MFSSDSSPCFEVHKCGQSENPDGKRLGLLDFDNGLSNQDSMVDDFLLPHSELMPRKNYNSNFSPGPSTTNRLELPLRDKKEKDLRKSCRASLLIEATDNNGGPELYKHEPRVKDNDNLGPSIVDQELEVSTRVSDGGERADGRPLKQRLLVVANRLPVSAGRRGEDSWSLEISARGLISALLGAKELRRDGYDGLECIPVFLDEDIAHQYYNGYCNNILWPLFRYLGLLQEDCLATTRSFQSQFAAYIKANQMFAEAVNRHYKDGDVVWCRHYHLLFLPKCLKDRNSGMKVGFSTHPSLLLKSTGHFHLDQICCMQF
ncbi:hypothetical protein Pint_11840 [Pistacia integerrima]|uniref:Uncharacterized protein n=1 Tax=Pistacia integerrima TaxID=434235 RepID=A0ACC0XKX1_9ROSI|nr:hypothetical protein Pint_11840 [Pistacia integerrima]